MELARRERGRDWDGGRDGGRRKRGREAVEEKKSDEAMTTRSCGCEVLGMAARKEGKDQEEEEEEFTREGGLRARGGRYTYFGLE